MLPDDPADFCPAGERGALGAGGMEGGHTAFICMYCPHYTDTEQVENLQSFTLKDMQIGMSLLFVFPLIDIMHKNRYLAIFDRRTSLPTSHWLLA